MNENFELVSEEPCCMTIENIDFWLDGPGDHTVRPCRPEHLEHAKAERAKIQTAQAEAGKNQTPPPAQQEP